VGVCAVCVCYVCVCVGVFAWGCARVYVRVCERERESVGSIHVCVC